LDLLSEQIAKSVGRTPLLLLDSLDRTVGGTDEESEARIVLPSWVEIVARVSTDSIPSIAAAWMEAVGAQEGDESIESSPDVEVALRSLVDLCAQATARGSAVVFGWYL
jgi:hypothetical protein